MTVPSADRPYAWVYAEAGPAEVCVCVPAILDALSVAAAVARQRTAPAGTRWRCGGPEKFADGSLSPVQCNREQGRRHWLVVQESVPAWRWPGGPAW